MLALWAAMLVSSGCTRTTVISAPTEPGDLAPIPSFERAPITCQSSLISNGGSSQLLAMQSNCEITFAPCTNNHAYALACDGLQCDCIADGRYDGGFLTPRCPSESEITRGCGWPIWSTDSMWPALPGDSCGEADTSPSCACIDGVVECAALDGCLMSGHWRSDDESLLLALAADGTMFASDQADATLERIGNGTEPGYFGTWQVADRTLHLKTVHHDPVDGACETVGSYLIQRSTNCEELQLSVLDDACAERTRLHGLHLTRD